MLPLQHLAIYIVPIEGYDPPKIIDETILFPKHIGIFVFRIGFEPITASL